LEATSEEMIQQIENLEGKYRVYRSIHRKLHLDQIEELLNEKKST
jgi:hypothetical protein